LTNLHILHIFDNPLSPTTLSITPSKIPTIRKSRAFLKCYFAIALNCSFPIVESIVSLYDKLRV
jgi:hypothetical protein